MAWYQSNSFENNKKMTPEETRRIIARFQELLPLIPALPKTIDSITLEKVKDYFKIESLPHPNVVKGIVIRQKEDEAWRLGLLLLDENNEFLLGFYEAPYGRQLLVKKLDETLKEAFGEKDYILVELKANSPTFADLLTRILEILERFIPEGGIGGGEPQEVEVITFRSVITYFQKNRPRDSRVKKGAILSKPNSKGYHLSLLFLDNNNNPVCGSDGKPYGCELVGKQLDDELSEAFGNNNLIIVE
jgi:hypothetical protein